MLHREVGEGRIRLVTASSAAALAVPARRLGGSPGSEPGGDLPALPAALCHLLLGHETSGQVPKAVPS